MLRAITLNAIMLSVVMLKVIMLNVVLLSVIMLSVIMLNVVMLSVIMLSVVAPVKRTPKVAVANEATIAVVIILVKKTLPLYILKNLREKMYKITVLHRLSMYASMEHSLL